VTEAVGQEEMIVDDFGWQKWQYCHYWHPQSVVLAVP